MNGVLKININASNNKAFQICQVNTGTHRHKHNDITSSGGTLWLCTSALWAACFHSEDLWVNPGMWRSLEPPSPPWTAFQQKTTDKMMNNIIHFKSNIQFWDTLKVNTLFIHYFYFKKFRERSVYVCPVQISQLSLIKIHLPEKQKWKNSAMFFMWVYA